MKASDSISPFFFFCFSFIRLFIFCFSLPIFSFFFFDFSERLFRFANFSSLDLLYFVVLHYRNCWWLALVLFFSLCFYVSFPVSSVFLRLNLFFFSISFFLISVFKREKGAKKKKKKKIEANGRKLNNKKEYRMNDGH